jgi:Flp pilus assembly protein TadG
MNLKGQAMVETALIIFFLITLVLAMTEFGRAMYTKNTLTNAARGIVRTAVVTSGLRESTSNAISCPDGTLTLNTTPASPDINLCNRYLIGCNGASINAQIQIFDSMTNTEKTSTPAAPGDSITVRLTQTNFASVVPRLFGPNGVIPFFPSSLVGSASMRYE